MRKVIAYGVLLLGAAIMLVPFVAAVGNSLKSFAQYVQIPPVWFPWPVHWENYTEVWRRTPFGTYLLNSLLVAVLAVVGNVLTSSLVGHALARMRLPGKQALLTAALGTMMLPSVITIVP